MRKVVIENAVPGMRLATAVENDAGMVLFGAGMEVAEQMISKLSSLNIASINVE